MVICEPIPVPPSDFLPCRSGQGANTLQNSLPPCNGLVKPSGVGQHKSLTCERCGLLHATCNKDGILYYGAVF